MPFVSAFRPLKGASMAAAKKRKLDGVLMKAYWRSKRIAV